jgi:hypothetical protein
MVYARLLFPLAVTSLLCVSASAQSIISVHSGVIHYFEGSVFVDGAAVEQRFGRFPEIKQGSELRTENGRVEVLLTPGVFLRVGEDTAFRMLSTLLIDTRVEFERGSAVVEAFDASPQTAVTLIYGDYQVRVPRYGLFRIDSEPPQLKVYKGKAEVSFSGKSVTVYQAQILPFSPALATERFSNRDGLDSWARERSDSIAAGNAAGAQTLDDSLIDSWQNSAWVLNPSFGAAGYGPLSSTLPLSAGFYSPFYSPYNSFFRPFGLGFWSPYAAYSVYVPPYYFSSRPTYSGSPGGSGYRTIPPSRIGTSGVVSTWQSHSYGRTPLHVGGSAIGGGGAARGGSAGVSHGGSAAGGSHGGGGHGGGHGR